MKSKLINCIFLDTICYFFSQKRSTRNNNFMYIVIISNILCFIKIVKLARYTINNEFDTMCTFIIWYQLAPFARSLSVSYYIFILFYFPFIFLLHFYRRHFSSNSLRLLPLWNILNKTADGENAPVYTGFTAWCGWQTTSLLLAATTSSFHFLLNITFK